MRAPVSEMLPLTFGCRSSPRRGGDRAFAALRRAVVAAGVVGAVGFCAGPARRGRGGRRGAGRRARAPDGLCCACWAAPCISSAGVVTVCHAISTRPTGLRRGVLRLSTSLGRVVSRGRGASFGLGSWQKRFGVPSRRRARRIVEHGFEAASARRGAYMTKSWWDSGLRHRPPHQLRSGAGLGCARGGADLAGVGEADGTGRSRRGTGSATRKAGRPLAVRWQRRGIPRADSRFMVPTGAWNKVSSARPASALRRLPPRGGGSEDLAAAGVARRRETVAALAHRLLG